LNARFHSTPLGKERDFPACFQPDNARRRKRWQLDSNRPEERLVRDPAPVQPVEPFFTKKWRPSEIELVR
jgi:hypothetical protein